MNKPIRILMVTGILDRGGAETMIMNMYRHIDRSKVQFDTYWGNRAYTFKQANPNLPCITVRVKLSAIQVNEGNGVS
ncbi:MAG: hypothetical protein IJJ44_11125 [Solobacterium sp.]|nr:hypothetical protein [Solobacterium sp.]